MSPSLLRLSCLVATGAALLAAGPAAAQRSFTSYPLAEAGPGLAVTGVLSDLRAVSRTHALVPAAWQRRGAPAGRLRFTVRQNANCSFDVTYAVTSVVGGNEAAVDRVATALPLPGAPYLLDRGERGSRAFRVVRRRTTGDRIRVDALWAGVLTKRHDIVPSGSAAWTEIRVTAQSRPGDECHSGTYRQALGPAIGDSLAVARTTLAFDRPTAG